MMTTGTLFNVDLSDYMCLVIIVTSLQVDALVSFSYPPLVSTLPRESRMLVVWVPIIRGIHRFL